MVAPDNIVGPGELLRKYGLAPRKSWGQNFLHDPRVHEEIVIASGAAPGGRPAGPAEPRARAAPAAARWGYWMDADPDDDETITDVIFHATRGARARPLRRHKPP